MLCATSKHFARNYRACAAKCEKALEIAPKMLPRIAKWLNNYIASFPAKCEIKAEIVLVPRGANCEFGAWMLLFQILARPTSAAPPVPRP